MHFDIYGRADGLRLLVPAILPQPHALAREGPLSSLGGIVLAFSALSPELSQSIALTGFGVASDMDDAMIDIALRQPGPFGERS
ncbi:hypothetical protein [Lysobacter claricitrinus]|uniref:hypothetical protein n=1 Tax=Lysobacter claricitrinus TaxID=3367728 RepID=UPI0037DB67BB